MKKILLYIAAILVVTSCTKLDEETFDKIQGSQFPESDAQIAGLSVTAYTPLRLLADDEGWWFLAQEISSDELCAPTRGSDWYDNGKWLEMYKHTWTNDNEGVNRMWDKLWSGVTTSNQILDILRTIPTSEAITKKIKEVEVLRSFFYYLIIDNYGDSPYLTTTVNVPAKPFKLKREAIYDSLVKTVESALPYLKAIDNKYMVTKYMGYALLAKLYINSEVYTGNPEWQKSLNYCDSVIGGPYIFDADVLSPFKVENQNDPEIIFSIPFDEDTYKGFRLHMRTLHYQHNLKYDMPVGPWNGFCAVPTFFNKYETADKRREGFHIFGLQYDINGAVIKDGETHLDLDLDPQIPAAYMLAGTYTPQQIRCTGARVGKYEIKRGTKENLSNDLPLFRLTDFILMKAECQIRLGQNGDVLVNKIRTRAGVTGWSNCGLDSLLMERGRELYCEGHRRQDLIRYGKFKQAWWEKPADATETETFPIPKWATDANPNLLLDPK